MLQRGPTHLRGIQGHSEEPLVVFNVFSRRDSHCVRALCSTKPLHTRLDDVLGENRSSDVYVRCKSRWRGNVCSERYVKDAENYWMASPTYKRRFLESCWKEVPRSSLRFRTSKSSCKKHMEIVLGGVPSNFNTAKQKTFGENA